MNKNDSYHQAYYDTYYVNDEHKKISKDKKNQQDEKIFLLPIIICIPIAFVFVFEFFFQNKNEEIVLNQNKQFLDFVSKEGDSTETSILDLDISDFNNFEEDNIYQNSKFEEVLKNYKDNFSKKINEKTVALKKSIFKSKEIFLEHSPKRKEEFVNVVLPLIIDQNEKVLEERLNLLSIKKNLNKNKTLSNDDQKFVEYLSVKYLVEYKNKHKIDTINELLIKVDIIPNSIVLAQAANESGWGSSRFAQEYNALFGEYTYNVDDGVIPAKRDEGKKHLIKYFSSLDKSIESYFININTHQAYIEFRNSRNKQRKSNNNFNVYLLVKKLDVYAEDDKYVDTLNSIIKVNNFPKYDDIKLLTTKL